MDARSDKNRTAARAAPEPGTEERLGQELDSVARSFDIAGRMERHPYVTIAAVAGFGFVIGGGLFRPFASRLIRTGLRVALASFAEQMIVRVLLPASARAAGSGNGGVTHEAGKGT